MSRAQDALRQLRALVHSTMPEQPHGAFTLGVPELDTALGNGLDRGALHEIFAPTWQDKASAAGFSAALALYAGRMAMPFLWICLDAEGSKNGILYGQGLAGFGIDPQQVLQVVTRVETDALRAAFEGVNCCGLGAVILDIPGPARTLDHTALRRLSLAAQDHGVTAFVLRTGNLPSPSPARSRWVVAAAPSQSFGLNLPGVPAFSVTLLKHRSGQTGQTWYLEWDHENACFHQKTLSRTVASLSSDRKDHKQRDIPILTAKAG